MGYNNIFLIGERQVGKSTAIDGFINQYTSGSYVIAGFKTKPFYENSYLKGYYIEDQQNPSTTVISENVVGINSDTGTGKCCYGITEVFENKGVEILTNSLSVSNSIILMDELGFFEVHADKFQEQVHRVLDSSHKVLGVIKEKRNEFLYSIACREDVLVIPVTLENRDQVITEIYKNWSELL